MGRRKASPEDHKGDPSDQQSPEPIAPSGGVDDDILGSLFAHGDSIRVPLEAESPALKAFALVAGLEAWKLAAAFNDPEHLFDHLTLDEIARFKAGTDLLASTHAQMVEAMDRFLVFSRGVLAGNAARED